MPDVAIVDGAAKAAGKPKLNAADLQARVTAVQTKVKEAGGNIAQDANLITDAARQKAQQAVQYTQDNPLQVGAGGLAVAAGAGAVAVAIANRDDIGRFLGDAIDGLGSGTEFGKRIALEKLDGLVGYAKEHPFKTGAAATGLAALGAAGTYAALNPEQVHQGFEAIIGGIKQSASDGKLSEAHDQLVALRDATIAKGQEGLDRLHELSGQAWTWAKENPGEATAIGAGGVLVVGALGVLAAKVAHGEGDLGDTVGKLMDGIKEHPVQSAAVATALGLTAAGVAWAKANPEQFRNVLSNLKAKFDAGHREEALGQLKEFAGNTMEWVKAHPTETATFIAAGVAVVGAGVSLWGAHRSGKSADRAEQAASESRAIRDEIVGAVGHGKKYGLFGPRPDANNTPLMATFKALHGTMERAIDKPWIRNNAGKVDYTPVKNALEKAAALPAGANDAAAQQIQAAAKLGLAETSGEWTSRMEAARAGAKTVYLLTELADRDMFARTYEVMRRLARDAANHPTAKSPETRTDWNSPGLHNLDQIAGLARPLAEQGDAFSQQVLEFATKGMNSGATDYETNKRAFVAAAKDILDLLPDNRSTFQKLFG